MNQKIILTLLSLWAFTANAQQNKSVLVDPYPIKVEKVPSHLRVTKSNELNKTEAAGTRTLNVITSLMTDRPDIINNVAVTTLFNDSTANILYSDSTVGSPSVYGTYQTFQPAEAINNYDFIFGGEVDFSANNGTSFTLDSLKVFGIYDRNDMTTTDSLILNISSRENGDLPRYYFDGQAANYGYDTTFFRLMDYNTTNNEANTPGGVRIAIPLTNASLGDTTAGGWSVITTPVGMNFAADDVIGVGVSFKYGGTWSMGDTINTSLNSFLARYFEEAAGQYPLYRPEFEHQSGIARRASRYDPNDGWYDFYLPTLAFTAPYTLEHLDLDYVVTCADCVVLSIEENKTVAAGLAYPNPTSAGYITIPLNTLDNTSITVSITNLLGQVISTQEFGQISGETNVNVNTKDLISGNYIANIITENGAETAVKFSVK